MSGLHRPQSLPVDPRPDGGQAPLTLATTSRPKAQTSKGDLSFLKKSRARHASDSSKFRWLTEWLTGRTSPTAPTPYFHCNHALGMSRNHANPFASGAKGRRFESCLGYKMKWVFPAGSCGKPEVHTAQPRAPYAPKRTLSRLRKVIPPRGFAHQGRPGRPSSQHQDEVLIPNASL